MKTQSGFILPGVAVSDNDWYIKHAVNRVMAKRKWATPGIIGGNVDIQQSQLGF